MPKVEIYSTQVCPYCVRAKNLLTQKEVEYTEYMVDSAPDKMEEMLSRSSGKRSVPQIFINDEHIGGCDDLYALDGAGELDHILKEEG